MSRSWSSAYASYDTWKTSEPESNWDKYYPQFELWLDSNYDKETGRVFGMSWDTACESDELLSEFIDYIEGV
jgi:hypothetical protein